MNLKNVTAVTLMVMASLISVATIAFCFYKLVVGSTDALYVSLLTSIVTAWISVAIFYIKDVLGISVPDTVKLQAV